MTKTFPLQFLTGASDRAIPVVWLTWGVLVISIAVMVIIAGLLAAAIWRRPGVRWTPGAKAPILPDAGGQNWLWVGVSLSALALLVTVVWTVIVLAKIQAPSATPAITIEVTGRQWWWQVRYLDGKHSFTTANEIHIPVGVPVRLKLIGGDVIHSFWVPLLAGKMDAIPGQTNETWIEAATPGTYSGQCTEYCGVQHAKMAFLVVAETPGAFRNWWSHQLAGPIAPQGQAAAGRRAFQASCAGCHAVHGTEAAGSLGPDLSHLMQRRTLASGVLPNDDATLAHWIADPQALKPGNFMPVVTLPRNQMADIHAYLKSLD